MIAFLSARISEVSFFRVAIYICIVPSSWLECPILSFLFFARGMQLLPAPCLGEASTGTSGLFLLSAVLQVLDTFPPRVPGYFLLCTRSCNKDMSLEILYGLNNSLL